MLNYPIQVRDAEESEAGCLATLWYEGWKDAHLHIVPEELTRARTPESFRERISALLPTVRVVGPTGAPAGLCIVKDNELYQLYVAPEARGTGAASALIADAETQIAQAGFETAWLACAIGNNRAARFYEKCGWRRVGNMMNRLDLPSGEYLLEVWRYEKNVSELTHPQSSGSAPRNSGWPASEV
ncbi:MAG TPA: GNAT family N-acetyltransferase [Pyrinomonadaceae bacterium]|nr:GNAT family N-acetyltransferase [Pyrinomonadaceae bacterium]